MRVVMVVAAMMLMLTVTFLLVSAMLFELILEQAPCNPTAQSP